MGKEADKYIDSLPVERQTVMKAFRKIILNNLPKGFEEEVGTMLNYVVPKSIYPDGYHCNPDKPLPFLSLASQKNFIALYHMGIYANQALLLWFTEEYKKHSKTKLDMGKSCIRFKKIDQIPFELISELLQKMTVDEWIKIYENAFKK
jgi:hypothetical protein